jgi:hypothetical protein
MLRRDTVDFIISIGLSIGVVFFILFLAIAKTVRDKNKSNKR